MRVTEKPHIYKFLWWCFLFLFSDEKGGREGSSMNHWKGSARPFQVEELIFTKAQE